MNKVDIKVSDIREEYTRDALDEKSLAKDPWSQFDRWFREALTSQVLEPNAMALSTVSSEGKPSSRVVLLKGYDPEGFVFFTNYNSRKGQELLNNAQASLLFFWPELQRQVRIEGGVEKVSAEDSDAYFASRPRSSQIGAIASPQSQVIADRSDLDHTLQQLGEKYKNEEVGIDRPEHWGGFRLKPNCIEFWQGRASRLHDRLVFLKAAGTEESGTDWKFVRLAP